MSISANAQITLINMSEAYTVLLTNESQQFPTNSSRVPLSNVSYYTDIVVYQGSTERTDYTIGTVSSSNNITVSQTASRVTFTVSTSSTISADSGTFNIPITIDGQTFNKIFSWSCAKQGATGTSAKSVDIVASSQVFKSTDGGSTFSPDAITLTPVFQGGISYSKWQYSTNGSTWTNVTSGSNGLTIASGVLTIAKSSNLYSDTVTSVSFKCISSTSTYYDIITVVKLYDVTNLVPQIEEIRTSISNVELKVDQNTKIISQKASQTDIANAINEYDNSTVETIRDTVAEHTTSIGNITSKVSEVESTVSKKANSSTVQTLSTKVSTLEQNADGFKQTVEKNYVAKADLNISSRNLLRNSKTLIFDSYGLVNGEGINYLIDESGNILTDEVGNLLIL